MSNILYISYDGMTDPLGQSQVLPYLFGLSQEGHSFNLISFEKPAKFDQHKEVIQKVCDQNNITWHPLVYHKSPPILSTIYDIRQMRKLAKKLHAEQKIELVHCRSYLASIVGLYLKQKHKVPFLFDMRGFWADERVDGNIWNLKNPIFKFVYKFFKKKELEYFNNADCVVSLTHKGKEEVLSWPAIKKDIKIEVIPCCADMNLFDYTSFNSDELTQIKKQYGIHEDDYVLIYIGNFSTVYKFDEVLEVYKSIKKTNLKFLVFSHESQEKFDHFLTESELKSDENIRYGSLPRTEIPKVLSIADYSIFFCMEGFSRKATSPTRLAEIMGCGLKVIINSGIGDTKEFVEENDLGYVFNGFNQSELEAFKKQFTYDKHYDKQKIRNLAITTFEVSYGIKKYANVYKQILKS